MRICSTCDTPESAHPRAECPYGFNDVERIRERTGVRFVVDEDGELQRVGSDPWLVRVRPEGPGVVRIDAGTVGDGLPRFAHRFERGRGWYEIPDHLVGHFLAQPSVFEVLRQSEARRRERAEQDRAASDRP
jgi:hypothetical protein